MSNLAAFKINGTPSIDVNGDRLFALTAGVALAITLEVNPAPGISSVTYELFDPANELSPLASQSARTWGSFLKFTENNARTITTTGPNDTVHVAIPSSGLPASGFGSWILRATAHGLVDQIYERGIAFLDSDQWREAVPTETTQFRKYGWADLITKGGGGGGGGTEGLVDDLGGGGHVVDNLGGGGTIVP